MVDLVKAVVRGVSAAQFWLLFANDPENLLAFMAYAVSVETIWVIAATHKHPGRNV